MKLLKKSLAIFLMAQCFVSSAMGVTIDQGMTLQEIGNYATGQVSEDGGIAEIIKFNPENNKFYLINGKTSTLEIIDLKTVIDKEVGVQKEVINIAKAIESADFQYGDITSVAVNIEKDIIAVAVQHKAYNKNGKIVVMDYAGKILGVFEAGKQPDMVTFTPDGNYLLAANEGEPRSGFGEGIEDPEGSVTLIDLIQGVSSAKTDQITFNAYDSQKESLIKANVLFKKGAKPSADLEPEYIAISGDSKKAYISLQEANAVATLDIASKKIESIKGLGFKDFSQPNNALDMVKDGMINIIPQNVLGTYMPDGITTYEVDGKTYLLTANEGDAREYLTEEFPHIKEENQYNNVGKLKVGTNSKGKDINIECLEKEVIEGLEPEKTYLFGARSFSIWDAETMTQVFDSGSDFEETIAKVLPDYFNATNKDTERDNRSGKKGPEPEDVKVGQIGERIYAFIGLERIGGVMVYDITNPYHVVYQSYINTRDFSQPLAGDSAPEGLEFIPASQSPTGQPLLLVANEVSGTVSVLEAK